jgi:hypothetical protein
LNFFSSDKSLIEISGRFAMQHSPHYKIDYLYHGAYKTFFIRSDVMNNAEAWHWAAVDAGIGQIPKYRSDKVPKVSKPLAERLGVTDVEWKPA